MQILTDRIIWDADDFLAGFLARQANNVVRLGRKGAAFMQNFDPYYNIPGTAAPGRNPTDVSNVSVVDGVLVSAAFESSGSFLYPVGGAKIHKASTTDGSLTNDGTFPHALAAAGGHSSGSHTGFSFALGNVVEYRKVTTRGIFYSYNDGTDWDVGFYDFSSFDDDFMSSAPTNALAGADLTDGVGKPHPLFVSPIDDLLYMGSSRYVHVYDAGSSGSGTVYTKVLTLGIGWEVADFINTDYDLVVFANNNARTGKRGMAKANFYSYGIATGSNPYKAIFLDDDEVSAPFQYLGTIGCFTRNRNNGRCALRLLQGNKFRAKFYYSGSLPVRDGVEITDNQILWNAAGTVYSWGSKDDLFPTAAHQLMSGSGASSGILRAIISGNLYMSSGTTTSGGLQQLMGGANNSYGTGNWQGPTAFPNFAENEKGQLTSIKVTFPAPASGGRSLALQMRTDADQYNKTIFTGVTAVTGDDLVRKYQADTSSDPLRSFVSIRPVLIWSTGSAATDAPAIEKIEAFYKSIKI